MWRYWLSPNSGGNDPTGRRNSCLASPSPYRYANKSDSGNSDDSQNDRVTRDVGKVAIELLDIPPLRKISDCSTNSSLSGDDFEVTELQPFQRPQVSDSVNSGSPDVFFFIYFSSRLLRFDDFDDPSRPTVEPSEKLFGEKGRIWKSREAVCRERRKKRPRPTRKKENSAAEERTALGVCLNGQR